MKKFFLIKLLFSLLLLAKPIESGQLIVVQTDNWQTSKGSLQRYEKAGNQFVKVGKTIEITLGRNGLGWGRGLHSTPKDAKTVKKEGDGKAPAGIFELKHAFGYEAFRSSYPYKAYNPTDHCVDDGNSKLYNKIVDSTKVKKDYKSFEHMEFDANYYKFGVVVNHNNINEAGAVKGAGSCIFLHIKSVPTAGCTVMSEAQMKEVILWLDERKNPLLVQGTNEVVKQLLKEIH